MDVIEVSASDATWADLTERSSPPFLLAFAKKGAAHPLSCPQVTPQVTPQATPQVVLMRKVGFIGLSSFWLCGFWHHQEIRLPPRAGRRGTPTG